MKTVAKYSFAASRYLFAMFMFISSQSARADQSFAVFSLDSSGIVSKELRTSSSIPDSGSTTISVELNVAKKLLGWTVYDINKCVTIDTGDWITVKKPSFGSYTSSLVTKVVSVGNCVDVPLNFNVAYYTWNNATTKSTVDDFSLNWTSTKYNYSETGEWAADLCNMDNKTDERVKIIAEYKKFNVNLTPNCSQFSKTAHTGNYSFQQLNTGDYSWALIRLPLVASSTNGYGLDAWVSYIGTVHIINSAYRNPARNAKVGGAPNSRHVYGDATDLRNNSQTKAEYDTLAKAALSAHRDYIEPFTGPCKQKCVHADWRAHAGSYAD